METGYVLYEFDRHGIEPAYLTEDQIREECGRYLDERIMRGIYDIGEGYPTASKFSFMVAKHLYDRIDEQFPTRKVRKLLRRGYSEKLNLSWNTPFKKILLPRKLSKF